MGKNRFSRFEARIQVLVEGGFARLFAGRLKPREVALRLARAMEDNARPDDDGQLAAPNRYAVHIHPDDGVALLTAHPHLRVVLAEHLITLAQESGLRLDIAPEVELVPDDALAPHGVLVIAEHVETEWQATEAMESMPEETERTHQSPRLPAAFLVVDGTRYVPLDRTVINVGRRRDNTIVVDDPRVSRQHCQLRFRFGKFVLYDLGSRGGTRVNGVHTSECVLQSGDVIALAGVPVVYVIDESSTAQRPAGGDTQVRMDRVDREEDGER